MTTKTASMVGRRYGRWMVTGPLDRATVRYPCRCDCGTERMVPRDNLRKGYSRSCGCGRANRRDRGDLMRAWMEAIG